MMDSPTPISMRGAANVQKPRAAPDSAVRALHSASPAAISRVRLTMSAKAPMNNPIAE